MVNQVLTITTISTCLVIIITTTAQADHSNQLIEPAIAKPGCLSRCGDVSIPFPFGAGSDACFSEKWFEIVCNYSTSPPKSFLKRIPDFEILNISVADGMVQTKNPVSFFKCPNKTSTKPRPLNLTGSPFSFSESRNRLTVVGCDTFGYINSSPDDSSMRAAGCTPICSTAGNSNSTAGNNSSASSRKSNCQTIIPSYLSTYEIDIDPDTRENASEQRCTYAFVADQKWFKVCSKHVKNFTAAIREMAYVPVTLNWDFMLDHENVYNSTNMSRVISSQCYKSEATSSISRTRIYCRCNDGYRGNPYLFPNGCQDIDECEDDPKLCKDDDSTCVNTAGSYKCEYKTVHKVRPALIAIGSGLGALVLLFGAWGLYKLLKRRKDIKRKKKFFKQNGGLLLQQQISSGDVNVEQKIKLLSSSELEKATDRFNVNRILGQGGQGTVYKGMLGDGNIVAVKKSKLVNQGKVAEFINEVVILSQISHRNVVKLLGCCLETEVPLLVYEFIPNGTLYHYIHDHNEEFQLTWDIRLRIATEVAGALSYLHSAASVPIYHRDIKSTNILLDEKFRAKVADFGTSRSVSEDQTHITTLVSGTFGYMDPEYFRSSQFTEKSDVYSFGVVIVELLSGQKPVSLTSSRKGRSLATHFIDCVEENRLFHIVDPRIVNEGCNNQAIIAVANLAYKCLNLIGKDRPTMKEVAMELEGIQKSLVKISSENQQIFKKTSTSHPYSRHEVYEPIEFSSTTNVFGSGSTTGAALSLDASTVLSSINASM